MRCDDNNRDKVKFYDPFCPKILATRKTFDDKATESRCLTHIAQGTQRTDIPFTLNDNFKKETHLLRNKLLMWRFRNYSKVDNNFDINYSEFDNLEPRVKQIISGFIQLFKNDSEQMKIFKEFINNYQEELISERKTSFDGEIVDAIYNTIKNGNKLISNEDIIETGQLKGFDGKSNMNSRALTNKLRALGFEKAILHRLDNQVKRCIPLKQEHLNNLFKRYGLELINLDNIEQKKQNEFGFNDKEVITNFN